MIERERLCRSPLIRNLTIIIVNEAHKGEGHYKKRRRRTTT